MPRFVSPACPGPACCSRFLRALFQFGKCPAGKAAKFSRCGAELLGVVGAARLECSKPASEARELIRRQLGDGFGDFFDFHGAPALVVISSAIGRFTVLY